MAADDCCVGADAGSFANGRPPKLVLTTDEGARIIYVRKNAGRSAKDIVGELDAGVESDIVLHLAAIADFDIRADHDILAEDAISADGDLGQNMNKVPYAGSRPNGDIMIDICRFMD